MTNTLYDALIAPHAASDAAFLIADDVPISGDAVIAADIPIVGDGATVTFAQFTHLAARIAAALVAQGLRPGDRIVVQAPKTVETVALYIGAVQAGAVFVPLNIAYTTDEVDYFITDAAAAVVVCEASSVAALAPIAARVGASVLTLNADGGGTLAQAAAGQPDQFDTVARGRDDLAALLYTSGTTGRSKGAMLSHDNLVSNASALTDLWQITANDRLIHALPIFHTHGLFVALNTALLAGAAVRLMARFDIDQIVDEMPRSTLMMGVPTFYTRLLADDRMTRDRAANMRLFISGSAPLLAETHTAFIARTGHRILERYGMTETNMITSNPYVGARRAGTVGLPLPGTEVVITDPDTSAVLPAGSVGMIEVRGRNVFKGYWNMPDKTAEELRDTGFFISGDLGVMDADGYLRIVGRIKDMIISGGYNIYPKEIEDVLNALPDVAESAVFGVPDADFGEAIVAAIVPVPGAVLNRVRLDTAVVEKLARFKHPRRIVVMENLPRNSMGKVQKNLLRADRRDQ